MLTYKDKAFCDASHRCEADCGRRFTEGQAAIAREMGLPVSYMPLEGVVPLCVGFKESKQ